MGRGGRQVFARGWLREVAGTLPHGARPVKRSRCRTLEVGIVNRVNDRQDATNITYERKDRLGRWSAQHVKNRRRVGVGLRSGCDLGVAIL